MTSLFKVKYSLHPLFILIILLSIVTGYFYEVILLFVFVLLHEWGHLVMAQHLGWHIKEIKLLPFGGVLIVDEAQGSNAREEILVAIAGPIQNVWIILLTFLGGYFDLISYEWTNYIITANIWLLMFNLLPILPLDGGKLIQSGLSYICPYFYTVKLSAWLSIVFSTIMIGFGLLYSLWSSESGPQLNLILVGIFLVADNSMKIKHLPYTLYRFILNREHSLVTLNQVNHAHRQPITILLSDKDTLLSLYKRVRREASHIFVYKPLQNSDIKMKTEHEILKTLNNGIHLNRALIEILD